MKRITLLIIFLSMLASCHKDSIIPKEINDSFDPNQPNKKVSMILRESRLQSRSAI